jgi:RNA polymerase-binding transcription factor DksA
LAPARETRIHISSKWKWHYEALMNLRDQLRTERGEKLSEAAEPLEPHSMDIADTATDELDHNLALAHLSAEQDALYEVEEALRRIREGTYGICQESGKRISAARLRAIPWTRFCRESQAWLEQKGAVKRQQLGKPVSLHESAVEGFKEAEADGEMKEQPEPRDEALWSVRTPPPGRKPGAERSRPRRARR